MALTFRCEPGGGWLQRVQWHWHWVYHALVLLSLLAFVEVTLLMLIGWCATIFRHLTQLWWVALVLAVAILLGSSTGAHLLLSLWYVRLGCCWLWPRGSALGWTSVALWWPLTYTGWIWLLPRTGHPVAHLLVVVHRADPRYLHLAIRYGRT